MTGQSNSPRTFTGTTLLAIICRLAVGGMFLRLGVLKAADLGAFNKVIATYDLFPIVPPQWINGITIYVPFLEIVLGMFLIFGLMQRAAFLVCCVMLVVFTVAVYNHGSMLQVAEGIPFCSVEFDCGCGTGVVKVCRKLAENSLLTLGALLGLVFASPALAVDRLLDRRGA